MTNINPLISIIIPTYNRAELIQQTLFSIENQSFKNWECIIVDDSSSDNTKDVLQGFVNRDSRFIVVSNSRKKGPQGARNTGLLLSKGKYISFFDSDNLMDVERYSRQLNFLIENPEYDVCTCFSHLLNDFDSITGSFRWITNGNILKVLLEGSSYVDYNSSLLTKAILNKIGLLDEDCPSFQEWDTFIRIAQIGIFCTVPELLIFYYQRSSDRISVDRKRELNGLAYIYSKHRELFIMNLGKNSFSYKLHELANSLVNEERLFRNQILASIPELKMPLFKLRLKNLMKKYAIRKDN